MPPVLDALSPAARPLHVGQHDEIPPLPGWRRSLARDQEIAGASEREAARDDRRLDRLEAAHVGGTTPP